VTKEIGARDGDGVYRIVEPFFAGWLRSLAIQGTV
jgi:hypothetical protein